jgi:phage terminase large subunit
LPRKLGGLFKPKRYKVLWGGRGGAKSWGVAKTLLMMAAHTKLRILCARELQVSISESVHKLLADQIANEPWLRARYEVQKTTIICTATGSEFFFVGIKNNVTKIKSFEGADICWAEEAEKVSNHSWQVLIPTIRKPGSEIWVTFNPDLETDPTSVRFLLNAPPGAWVQKIGHEDNPWLPKELREEMEYLYKIDPEAAAHVWGGGFRTNSEAQIFRGKYRVEAFTPEPDWDGPYYGADWGFSVDPTALVQLFIHDNTLYIYNEAYGHHVDIDDTPELFDGIPGARKAKIRADSARPETISYMNRHGYGGVTGASKWQGSVEDGIAFLRSFKAIVIHPRCKHAQEEARLYSFKVDRLTKDVTTDIEDKHNHIWDAVRYALEPLIKQSTLGMLNYLKQLKSDKDATRKEA